MRTQATIRDVASLAGVSVATASRVMSNSPYAVSEAARSRVRAAAEQLNYVPNETARSLRREANREIALVIPNVSNPFYLEAMLGINDVLLNNDYTLTLCNTMRDPEQEHRFLRMLYERRIQGVILSSVDENARLIEQYSASGMRFVLLDQMFSGSECMGIDFDAAAGGRMAAQYLISQGHRRIAFATMQLSRWTRTELYKGFREAGEAAGVTEEYLFESLPDLSGTLGELKAGQELAKRFLAQKCPATAVVCMNDMLAIGMIRSFIRSGVRVPEDISVIGFDDIPLAEAYVPALTTVRYPAHETGRLAALMLLDSLGSENSGTRFSMKLQPQLVIRETVRGREE